MFLLNEIKKCTKQHILADIHRNVHKTQIASFFFLNSVSPSDAIADVQANV